MEESEADKAVTARIQPFLCNLVLHMVKVLQESDKASKTGKGKKGGSVAPVFDTNSFMEGGDRDVAKSEYYEEPVNMFQQAPDRQPR